MFYEVVIASTNMGKIRELKTLLENYKSLNFKILSLKDFNIEPPEEPYETFLENAVHKAKYYGLKTNKMCLADDSGVCLDALNGFPGVRTKEYTVECGGMDKTFIDLSKRLEGIPNAKAFFGNALAFYNPKTDTLIKNYDQDHGVISFPARGHDGFGFDPVFIPNGYDQTFAQLGMDVKNKISHRAKALEKLLEMVAKNLLSGAS